jgi:hypothetical protein
MCLVVSHKVIVVTAKADISLQINQSQNAYFSTKLRQRQLTY